MTPPRGNTFLFRSFQQLPRLRLGPLKDFLNTAPFSGPGALLPELQRYKDTVCRARRGGPRTPSTTTDANLNCAFVENALVYTDP